MKTEEIRKIIKELGELNDSLGQSQLCDMFIDQANNAVEKAFEFWVGQSGVDAREFCKHYGYSISLSTEESSYGSVIMKVLVKPVLLTSSEPVWASKIRWN